MTHPYLAHPGPIGMAHRGAHGDGAGENSDAAFAHAVELGYRHLETDVHLSADGVLVALHDDHLDRTTDGAGPVADRTWQQLRQLRVRGGGRVARLDELLARWPHVRWNIDCKTPAAADSLAAAVAGELHRVCVASFAHAVLRQLRRRLGPEACTSASEREVRAAVGTSRLATELRPRAARLLGRVLAADVLQVPREHEGTPVATRALVETVHAAGLDVHVWTVDEPAEQERLLELGADGLITDDAAGLVRVLSARGAWPPLDAPASRP